MTAATTERTTLADKALVVLRALQGTGPQGLTADEFVSGRGWYVNSWAPVFTHLRKAGLVQRTGDKRPTTHGSEAYVVTLTDAGREALR